MSVTRFSLFYIMYCAFLAVTASVLQHFYAAGIVAGKGFWLIFGFLAGITFIAYLVADMGIKRNPETGIMAIMGSIALKMIFSMAFVLIYSLNNKEKGMVFVLNFFSLYLLFSFFEIYALLRNLRHQNK